MDDVALLELAYRSRPETLAELVELSHLTEREVADAVRRLEADGSIASHDGLLRYPPPGSWAAGAVTSEVVRLRRTTDDALAQIASVVERLPRMLQHWSVGESASDLLPVIARHGPQAAEDLWYATAQHDHGHAEAVFPDVARFLRTDPDRAARFAKAFAGKESVRALLPAGVAADPALAAIAARYADAGVQFRLSESLPSWFWIDGDLLAIPLRWGEAWPTSVLGVRSASLAALARRLFEELWRHAEPLAPIERSWTSLLTLMRHGVTLDSASRTLGINPRTGRRRVAAAMEHYGVSTLFALGVAWSADRDGEDRALRAD